MNQNSRGKTFVQPAISDYAFYAGHTPSSHDYTAFSLSVTVDTDMNKVPVEIKGDDGYSSLKEVSRTSPTVSFPISENTASKDRVLTIYVNGENTGKTVVQGAAPAASKFSVVWSPGYLTVKDGAYTFAGPKEKGMYFKWKSRYGIDLGQKVTSTSKYPGKAYGPEETTIAYADIKPDEVDPCSLVLPAGTWRMPSEEDFLELTKGGSKETSKNEYYMCSDGEQTVYLSAAGQFKKDASGVFAATNVFAWTSTPGTKTGNSKYLMWTFLTSSGSGTPKISPNTDNNQGLQVRCVRDK